jgi:deoxyribodipyrimidine photolyase-related protein
MKTALILYPHQLYPAQALPKVDTVFMVEEPLYFGMDQEFPLKLHKQKMILHRASMQRYATEVLWPSGVDVQYVELDVLMKTADILEKAKHFEHVYVFDPIDEVLTKRLLVARRENEHATALEFLRNPNFYLKDHEAREYFGAKEKHQFSEFYQWQRERFNILIDENFKPVGGQWMYENDKPHKVPKDQQLPTFAVFGDNKYVRDAVKWAGEHFPNNPGEADCVWPTNHAEAAQWLDNFVDHRIDHFGKYQDALDGQAAWLYHSALSSSLQIGLLSPQQIVDTIMKRHQKKPIDLPSLEAFIRQVVGWREYMRGMYVTQRSPMKASNPFKHSRRLTNDWYQGTLGLPPFDDMVRKLQSRAYVHHVERLMIASNLMILCEIQPDDMQKWFGELFIDAYEWVTTPNVYLTSQFAHADSVVTQPCISPSTYILETSHYERGEWCNIWDGLYWRFVEKHRSEIGHNPHLRVMVQRLNRLDPDRKRIISYRAEDFLTKFTR